jgi:2-polyprenyl-3-methyl-5-hydroxy-6-metoxy-1,4-benzoquinol methylase
MVRRHGPQVLAQKSWYYTVELADGVVANGQYDPELPMVPRLLTRQVDLTGMDCLDLGSVEGLMPTLMVRGGAARVLATDFTNYCADKMVAVKQAYDVDFDFQGVGLMYDLHTKIRGGFDFINCSGLLYHTWSPLDVLAGIRPLLKRNGIMLVSTNVVVEAEWTAEFNAAGRLNQETNTFWYLSVPTLDYLLRYLRLRPIDALLVPEADFRQPLRGEINKQTGYLGVLCRADDTAIEHDDWMAASARESWEHRHRTDWRRAERQPQSTIRLKTEEVDDPLAVGKIRQAEVPALPDDSHMLRLAARS